MAEDAVEEPINELAFCRDQWVIGILSGLANNSLCTLSQQNPTKKLSDLWIQSLENESGLYCPFDDLKLLINETVWEFKA